MRALGLRKGTWDVFGLRLERHKSSIVHLLLRPHVKTSIAREILSVLLPRLGKAGR